MITPAIPEVTPDQIEAKFTVQEKRFAAVVSSITILREFVSKWRNELAAFEWNAFDSEGPKVFFDCTYGNKEQQKNIASAFGKDGWVREKDIYTCGRINWKKTIGEVMITIQGAEHLNPKLIDEVKL